MTLAAALAAALALAVLVAAIVFAATIGPRPDIDAAAATARFPFKFVVTTCSPPLPSPRCRAGAASAPGGAQHAGAGRRAAASGRRRRGRTHRGADRRLGQAPRRRQQPDLPDADPADRHRPVGAIRRRAASRRAGASVLAGAVAGLAAGGVAATLYAAHCTDNSPLFVATWYTPRHRRARGRRRGRRPCIRALVEQCTYGRALATLGSASLAFIPKPTKTADPDAATTKARRVTISTPMGPGSCSRGRDDDAGMQTPIAHVGGQQRAASAAARPCDQHCAGHCGPTDTAHEYLAFVAASACLLRPESDCFSSFQRGRSDPPCRPGDGTSEGERGDGRMEWRQRPPARRLSGPRAVLAAAALSARSFGSPSTPSISPAQT